MFIDPESVPSQRKSNYPKEFQAFVKGRSRKKLGDVAGLTNFGVNLVELEPGSYSSVRHWHSKQDEFIYVLEGEITLMSDRGEQLLHAGDCAGFPAGEANGHHLQNRADSIAIYLEIGDRSQGDKVTYPDADLLAQDSSKGWVFTRKNGVPYS